MTKRLDDETIKLIAESFDKINPLVSQVIRQLQGDLKLVLDRETETHSRHDKKLEALEKDRDAGWSMARAICNEAGFDQKKWGL